VSWPIFCSTCADWIGAWRRSRTAGNGHDARHGWC
jgi:hypothetical protein